MYDIKEISALETYDIRHKILRPHQDFNNCKYDTDNLQGSFHIGGFAFGKLVSIVSFCNEKCEDFDEKNQFRLRAMATIEEFRGKGIGRLVVAYGEKILCERDINLVWCKARVSAMKYYEKLGYKVFGNPYDYPGIGLHINMYKFLNK